MRLRLEYFDQNEDFALLLPRDGSVERFVTSVHDDSWVLFHLDSRIEYEGQSYSHLLLRSRWVGQKIGDAEPTSVFILLVDDAREVLNGFNMDDFDHVAWGMVDLQ